MIIEAINLRKVQSATAGVNFVGQIYSSCMTKRDKARRNKTRRDNPTQDKMLHCIEQARTRIRILRLKLELESPIRNS